MQTFSEKPAPLRMAAVLIRILPSSRNYQQKI
jgi:hypothetical protein